MRANWLVGSLLALALLVGGCAKGGGPVEPVAGDPVSVAVHQAREAAGAVGAATAQGDLTAARAAYERFSAAFGQVLSPLSFADIELAAKLANANSRIKESLLGGQVDRAQLMADVRILQDGLQQAVAALEGGAAQPAAAVGDGRHGRLIVVTATDHRFEPARIEVERGTKVTIRLVNKGTVDHEFEIADLKFEVGPIKPGGAAEKSFVAERAGVYGFECDREDHLTRGMRGVLVVK